MPLAQEPDHTVGYLFREVVRLYVRDQRAQALCGDGTSTVQCHVLNELLRNAHLTQQNLVDRLGFDKGWISRAVDALVQAGHVTKTADDLDRRCVRLGLTKAGHKHAASLDQTLNDHAGRILEAVPHSQRASLQRSLQLLLEALQQDSKANSNTLPACGSRA